MAFGRGMGRAGSKVGVGAGFAPWPESAGARLGVPNRGRSRVISLTSNSGSFQRTFVQPFCLAEVSKSTECHSEVL